MLERLSKSTGSPLYLLASSFASSISSAMGALKG
jgi:hypothetical protein